LYQNDLAMRRSSNQNLLFQAPPCFGIHVKPLVPAAFAVVSTHSSSTSSRRPVVKIIAEFLSQHDEKHVVQIPLRDRDKGRKKCRFCDEKYCRWSMLSVSAVNRLVAF
jgi:hypothetical protein